MTEVLFYHLQGVTLEQVLPALVEKSLERGWRAAVEVASEERADALDAHLWTYRDDSFLPHSTWRERDASSEPVLIVMGEANPNGADIRFIVDRAVLPGDTANYQRVVLMFSDDDDEAVAAAREAWAVAKAAGHEVTYWQPDQQGRWQRKA